MGVYQKLVWEASVIILTKEKRRPSIKDDLLMITDSV